LTVPAGAGSSATPAGNKKTMNLSKRENSLNAMENKYGGRPEKPTDVEEVWFSGCHCDIGGGSVDNDTPHSLARIALRWMIRECFKADSGILFMADGLRSVGLDPASLWPYVTPRPPPLSVTNVRIQGIPRAPPKMNYAGVDSLVKIEKSEEEHELLDAMSPVYDQLALAKFWWALELLPVKQRYQTSTNHWASYLGANLGRGRFIPSQKKKPIKIHRSVKMRMDTLHEDGTKYVPRASFEAALQLGNVQWID